MADFLPPVVATLLADTKEFSAKVDEAALKMREIGGAADESGGKFSNFASKASTAVLATGAALGVYAVDKAYKFQESLDAIKNQAGLTNAQLKILGNQILNISSNTGVATSDLTSAALQIEQAGIRGSKAYNLLNDAAKAAVITNTSVASTTSAIVAAQSLQIAKGMSLANLTGVLVKGSQSFVGGLTAEEAMLSGKVGTALANYGLKLKNIIPIGAEFAKVGLPTRSITSFVNGLGSLQGPMVTSTGKIASYTFNLQKLGLSQQALAQELREGNISGLLQSISDAASRGGGPLSEYVNAVFGKSGGAAASVLIKNLNDLKKVQTSLAGAGSGSLTEGFNIAIKQLGPGFKKLINEVEVDFTRLGMHILPAAGDVLNWANNVMKYFDAHPLLGKIAAGAGVAIIGAAAADKLLSGLKSVWSIVQQNKQTALLSDIAANTSKMALTGGVGGLGTEGEGAAGGVGGLGAEGAGAAGAAAIGLPEAVFAAGAGIIAFEGTTKILRSNFLHLGGAVVDVASWIEGAKTSGTAGQNTAEGRALAKKNKAILNNPNLGSKKTKVLLTLRAR